MENKKDLQIRRLQGHTLAVRGRCQYRDCARAYHTEYNALLLYKELREGWYADVYGVVVRCSPQKSNVLE